MSATVDAISLDMLQGLIAAPTNARGIYKDVIREFDKDPEAPAYVDVTLMPFAEGKSVNNLKQSFLSNLPPKNEKAPESWKKIVVRTPDVVGDDGETTRHVYLLHIDRIAAMAAAAAEAASTTDDDDNE